MSVRVRLQGKRLALLLSACMGLSVPSAYAQTEGTNLLKLESARRFMVRFGYTYIDPNDRSKDTKDLTGAVVPYGTTVAGSPNAVNWAAAGGTAPLTLQVLDGFGNPASNLGIPADHPTNPNDYALGIPKGIRNKAGSAGSPTVSVLAYLDEERQWGFEGYILAVPFKNKLYGAGIIGGDAKKYSGLTTTIGSATFVNAGSAVDLGEVASTRQLPATVVLHRFFGPKDQKLRFGLGIGATYAIFFDTHAAKSLENYAGGPTKIKIKNAFGIGPFGSLSYALDERWSLNATVGYVKLKTSATLTTKVDPDILGVSPAQEQSALEIGPRTLYAVLVGRNTTASNGLPGTVDAMRQLAITRTGDPHNLGTYKRKIETSLDPLVLSVSVGYEF